MGVVVRRAEPGDQRGLTTLVGKAGGPSMFRKLFGSYNFSQMIETSYLSVSALSTGDPYPAGGGDVSPPHREPQQQPEVLVGFAILSDTPRAGVSEDWLEWFSETHAPAEAEVTMTNTLWVDFAVAIGTAVAPSVTGGDDFDAATAKQDDEEAAAGVIEDIVRTVFNTLPEIDYLVLSLPGDADAGGKSNKKGAGAANIPTPAYLLRAFELLSRHVDASPNNLDEAYGQPLLLLCDRMAFLPTLAVRPACVEDHDDLMPVFAAQSDLLSATYGEFFLADMIELQDNENKALAALVQGRACGLLATSSDLELGLLQSCFQLDDYEHLVKMSHDTRNKLADRRRKKSDAGEGGLGGTGGEEEPSESPRVLILGPPGAGKTTLAVAMAIKYGSVLVSVDAEAKAAADAGSEQGERAMKLLDAGEVLPSEMILSLVGERLASRECQKKGWVLEGVGAAGGLDELEEAIVMATEVGMEDFTATRPSTVIVLDLESEEDVLNRVRGRRVDMATGTIYHETLRPPPPSDSRDENDGGFAVDTLPGDGNPSVVTARLESYRSKCDSVVRSFAMMEGPEGGGTADAEQKHGDGGGDEVSQWDSRVSAVDAWVAADHLAAHGQRVSDDGGSTSSSALAAMPPNAFAVTLFCLESRLESRAADFLPHAFLLYPDRDYCVLTLPSVGAESVLLRHFSPVPARPGSAFNHVLYVMHRDSLPACKYLRVSRFVGSSHRAGVSHLVDCWGGADLVMAAVKDADQHQSQELIDNPPSAAFVATMGHQVVGVFVANREACGGDEVARIRSEFEVEDYIAFDRHRPRNQAVITALALNPIFAGHCRFALKEVMRLYDKSVIYWRSTPGSDLPSSVPWHMIPVRPRQQMQPQPGDVAPTYTGGGGRKKVDSKPAALFFLSRRYVTEPKITANRRVVVVGASSTALACLEGLAFTPYLNLTSLTLVSPNGIPAATDVATTTTTTTTTTEAAGNWTTGDRGDPGGAVDEAKSAFPEGGKDFDDVNRREERGNTRGGMGSSLSPIDEDAPDADRMARMGLERHVRVVRSRMVHLDRENGAILLPDGSVVPYDVLVLCTGLQDDSSRRLGLWAPGLDPSDPGVPGFVSLDSPFLRSDVERALASAGPDAEVVVYSSALKALCAAQGLIDLGVAPRRITVVRSLPAGAATPVALTTADVTTAATVDRKASSGKDGKSANLWSLGDDAVDTAVMAAAAWAGIKDAGGRRLEGVRVNADGGVAAAVFATRKPHGHGGGVQDGERRKQCLRKSRQKNGEKETARTGASAAGEVGAGRGGRNGTPRGNAAEEEEEEEEEDVIVCGVLLCGDTPNADPDVFRAANNSGLVYDGRLVVDLSFRTSDPSVLAGGTLTKFSRVYGAGAPRHEKLNAREVGTHLATCVLQQIDPLLLSEGNGTDLHSAGEERYPDRGTSRQGTAYSETSRAGLRSSPTEAIAHAVPLPMFNKPRCVSGKLPGGLWYVRATLPPTADSSKRPESKATGGHGVGSDGEGDGESDTEDGRRGDGSGAAKSFTTGAVVVGGCGKGEEEKEEAADGNVGVTGDYCLVRVDSLDRVCDVIYCGRGAVEAKNLSKVVGVQLGYLQRLETAFERGEVSSWTHFFRRGALTPLYHDRFPKLSEELREALANGDEAAANLLSALSKGIDDGMADEWLSLTIRKAVGPGACELPPSTRKTVEARALEWVRRNRGMLPRLALPVPQQPAGGVAGVAKSRA
eukprot:g9839.t1